MANQVESKKIAETNLATAQTRNNQLLQDYQNLLSEFTAVKDALSDADLDMATLHTQNETIPDLKETIKVLTSKNKKLLTQVQNQQENEKQHNDAMELLQEAKENNLGLIKTMDRLKKEMKDVQDKKEREIQQLKQHYSTLAEKKINTNIQEYETQIQKLNVQIKKLNDDREQMKRTHSTLEKSHDHKVLALNQQIDLLKQKVATLESNQNEPQTK